MLIDLKTNFLRVIHSYLVNEVEIEKSPQSFWNATKNCTLSFNMLLNDQIVVSWFSPFMNANI